MDISQLPGTYREEMSRAQGNIVSCGLVDWEANLDGSIDRFTTQLQAPGLTRFPDGTVALDELMQELEDLELASDPLPGQVFYYLTVDPKTREGTFNYVSGPQRLTYPQVDYKPPIDPI